MHQNRKHSDAKTFGHLTAGGLRGMLIARTLHQHSAPLKPLAWARKPSEGANPRRESGAAPRVSPLSVQEQGHLCLVGEKLRNHEAKPTTSAEPQRVSLLQICSCSAAFICHSCNHLGGILMVSVGLCTALQHIPDHLKAKPVPLTSPGRSL